MTVVCPSCGHDNPDWVVLCDNCKAILTEDGRLASSEPKTQKVTDTGISDLIKAPRGTSTLEEKATLVLIIKNKRYPLRIPAGKPMVVGRLDRFSTSIPTFDLSEIGGWESGVSRNHAQLRREGNKLYLVDLKSSNGTFLNGQRLVPGKEQLLHDGDTIRLGLLDIKAVFDKDLELTEDER